MRDMADRMELLADDIFAELQDVFVDEMNREEFLIEFLVHLAHNTDMYRDIFSQRVLRLGDAYRTAVSCFIELDELRADDDDGDEFRTIQVKLPEQQTLADNPQASQKVLDFPIDPYGMPSEDNDEQG